MNSKLRLVIGAGLLTLCLAPSAARPEGKAQADKPRVHIGMLAFAPESLTVKAGTDVTFTNDDPMLHSVIADNDAFASEALEKGESFTVTLSTPGAYPYHCGIHARMTGTITVVP